MNNAKFAVTHDCKECNGSGKSGKTVEEAMEIERGLPLGGVITMGAPPDCYESKLRRIMNCHHCNGSGSATSYIPLQELAIMIKNSGKLK